MQNLVQMTFDYSVLDTDTREFVRGQAMEIRTLMKRSAEDIVMIGIRLIDVKDRLGHGNFMDWVRSEFQMSQVTAVKFMRVAETHAKFKLDLNLPASVLYELSAPSTSETIIEQVQSGEVLPSLDAIKEAKEAERRAKESAQLAQQQLLQERQTRLEAQSQLEQYNQQIAKLQTQIETISKPEETIREIEVIPLDVTKELKELHEKVDFLTRHRNKLAEEAKELGKIAEAATAERNTQEQDMRIRQQWRVTCTDLKQAVLKALSHWPLAADTQVFETYEWDCLAETRNTIHHFLEVCNTLHSGNGAMIIDAVET